MEATPCIEGIVTLGDDFCKLQTALFGIRWSWMSYFNLLHILERVLKSIPVHPWCYTRLCLVVSVLGHMTSDAWQLSLLAQRWG